MRTAEQPTWITGSWLAAVVGTALAVGLLAVGLVPPVCLLTWAVAVGLLAAVLVARSPSATWPSPALFLALLALYTGLQLTPLPRSLLGILSPSALEVRTFGWPQADGAWLPLTLDPPATAAELVKYLAYAAFALLCGLAVRLGGHRDLARGIVLAGAAFVVAALAQTLLGAPSILWLYRPTSERWGLVQATLVNANHVSAVMGALVPSTIACGLRYRGTPRIALLVLACTEMALAVATLSRGGTVAAILGVVTFWVLARAPSVMGRAKWIGLAVGVVGVLLTLILAFERVEAVVAQSSVEQVSQEAKLKTWRDALPMVRDYPAFGAGRGTFVTAFTRYRRAQLIRDVTFHHAESLPLQLATEWGAPAAAAVLVFIGLWLARRIRRVRDSTTRAGAVAGVTALFAQNLVDFSLEVPAVAALAIALASLASERHSERDRSGHRWGRSVLIGACVLVPLVAWRTIAQHSYLEDGRRLARYLRSAQTTEVTTSVRALLERHPSDYALALMMAQWHARGRRSETMRWLNRALFLSPKSGSIHLAVANVLASAGWTTHALLELRIAAREEPLRTGDLARMAARAGRGWDQLRVFVGTGRGSAGRATRLVEALRERGRNPEVLKVCEALARRSDRPARHWGLSCLAETGANTGQASVARTAADKLAREHAEPPFAATAVTVFQQLGPADRARAVLEDTLRRYPRDPRLLALAARTALGQEDGATALRHATVLESAAGTVPETLAEALVLQGFGHLLEGRPRRALSLCERAQSMTGVEVEALRCVRRAARGLRDRRLERSALEELAARGIKDEAPMTSEDPTH